MGKHCPILVLMPVPVQEIRQTDGNVPTSRCLRNVDAKARVVLRVSVCPRVAWHAEDQVAAEDWDCLQWSEHLYRVWSEVKLQVAVAASVAEARTCAGCRSCGERVRFLRLIPSHAGGEGDALAPSTKPSLSFLRQLYAWALDL